MKRDEDHIQETCVRWYRLVHRDKMITSFPAGYVFGGDATKRAILGKRMKDMGYMKGVPDLFIPHANRFYHGMFIEMKTPKGRLSPEQKESIRRLESENYKCTVCRSLDEFMKAVNEYMEDI